MEQKKDKGGRRFGIKKKTIGFKVPEVIHEEVREEARPIIETIVKRRMKKLLPILLIVLASCSKGLPDWEPVRISQGGESVLLQGYLLKQQKDTHVYMVELQECDKVVVREVRIAPGQVYGELHFQSNCVVKINKIVYDDILRQ